VPDVAFDAVVAASTAPAASDKWHKEPIHYLGWMYHDGVGYCRWEGANGKPSTSAKWKRSAADGVDAPLKSLAEESASVWNRWDDLQSRRLAVFDLKVSRQKSGVAPFSGSRLVDYSRIVYYDHMTLGAAQYLLSTASTVTYRRGAVMHRVKWVLRNFHKFEADSSVTFPQ
jgi:hypothetical protein